MSDWPFCVTLSIWGIALQGLLTTFLHTLFAYVTCYRSADVTNETRIWLLLLSIINNNDSLLGWTLPKIRIIPKKASNKSFSTSNFGQKSLRGHMCISPGVELRGSKDDIVYMKLYRNGEIHSLLGWTPPNICIIPKKASNKSCSEIFFIFHFYTI